MNSFLRVVAVTCGMAAGVLLTGCSSSDSGGRTAEGKKAVVSLKDTRQELVRAKTEVNDATNALDKLAAGGNPEQAFKQYTAALKDVEAAGQRAGARAKAMRENARAYVAKWEKEMDQISSAELKAGAAERRQRVKQNFDDITAAGRSVRDAYTPFLKSLQDIHKVLANDLTPDGINAAKGAIAKAKSDGGTVNERIDILIAKLDEVSAGMSGTSSVSNSN